MPTEYLEQKLVQSAWAYRTTSHALDAILEVPSEAFQGHAQRHLWDAMRHVASRGKELSEVEVMQYLQSNGLLGPEGMYWQSFKGFLGNGGKPEPLAPLREAVTNAYVRRASVDVLNKALATLEDPATSPVDYVVGVSEELHRTSQLLASNSDDPFGTFMADIAEFGKPVASVSKQGLWTVSDQIEYDCAFPRGGVHITGAARNVGKTISLLTSCYKTISRGEKVTFVSMDMPYHEIISKLATGFAGLRQSDVQNGNMTAGEKAHLIESTAYVRAHVDLIFMPCMTVWDKVKSAIVRSIRKHDPSAVMLDHFGQIGTKKAYGEAMHERRAYISHDIKNIAQAYNVAFALAVQIGRQGAYGEPGLSDLAETTALEQDAMSVCLLWPEEDKEGPKKDSALFGSGQVQTSAKFVNVDTVQCRLAKNQVGAAGKLVSLKREGAFNRFVVNERYSR